MDLSYLVDPFFDPPIKVAPIKCGFFEDVSKHGAIIQDRIDGQFEQGSQHAVVQLSG
jgi:hypothetical protein